jgi:toxin HigB-1
LIPSFLSKEIREVCENEQIAKKMLGSEIAEKLQNRLADIVSANFVTDLLAGNPMLIRGTSQTYFKLDLTSNCQIRFTSNHNKPPLNNQGKIDWSKVRRIKILEISQTQ